MDTTLRVNRLAGYGLEVPDVSVAQRFFEAFGLKSEQSGNVLQLRTLHAIQHEDHPEILVAQGGAHKRLQHLAFGAYEKDLPRFDQHLRRMGVTPSTPPFGAVRKGLWFQDPWGTWICLVGAKPVPAKATATSGARVDRHLWQELERTVRPNKLGHALMYTQDWEKAEAFLIEALGLRVADRAAGKVSFLSAGTGVRDHHCFGLINSSHRGIQHASFHVDSFDAIGFGAVQMHKAGYTEGFGVGRHALASNVFYYSRDPWGSWLEYYSDMDQISDAWVSKDWSDLPYIWPQWAPEFWRDEMNANHEPR
jgi:catechol-2,3-dioxygenase